MPLSADTPPPVSASPCRAPDSSSAARESITRSYLRPVPPEDSAREAPTESRRSLRFRGDKKTVWIYIAAGASFAALAARGLAVPLYAHDLGANRFEVGALFAVSTLAAALLSLPSGVMVDRFGPRNLLAASFVLSAVSQLAIAFTPSVAPLFLWQVVGGLAAGAQQAALFSAVTEAVEGGRIGRAMGWLTLSMQTGFFAGPLVAGAALRWLDLRADIAVTTALLLLAVPGAIVASGTRQHTGTGFPLRAPLRALVRQP